MYYDVAIPWTMATTKDYSRSKVIGQRYLQYVKDIFKAVYERDL